MEYRELGKLSTYVDALPELVNEEDGRIHTSFNQTGAITGRIASSNPNCKTSPSAAKWGSKFGAALWQTGAHLLAADYSQVELRILAT
ncbi:MAG: DNA polymerase [Chloroflexota bacterium]